MLAEKRVAQFQFLNYKRKSNLWIGIGLTVVGLLWLIPYVWKQWRTVKEVGVPPVRFINEEKVVSASQENEVYSQVIVTDRLMAVELPDEGCK